MVDVARSLLQLMLRVDWDCCADERRQPGRTQKEV